MFSMLVFGVVVDLDPNQAVLHDGKNFSIIRIFWYCNDPGRLDLVVLPAFKSSMAKLCCGTYYDRVTYFFGGKDGFVFFIPLVCL